jgi:glycine cleavage system protein P-like pyridoxal-binding family
VICRFNDYSCLPPPRGEKEQFVYSSFSTRTNPASAAMAGMTIIVTKTMENGIDVEDVREKSTEI